MIIEATFSIKFQSSFPSTKSLQLFLYYSKCQITYYSTIEDEQSDKFKLLSPLCWLCVSKHDISIIAISNVFVDVRRKLVDKLKKWLD